MRDFPTLLEASTIIHHSAHKYKKTFFLHFFESQKQGILLYVYNENANFEEFCGSRAKYGWKRLKNSCEFKEDLVFYGHQTAKRC